MYSHKRMITVVVTVFMALACTTMLAAKDNPMGVAEKQTINFSAPIMVGGTLLPAGNYNITHQMVGQTHVMMFKQIRGNAEAKVNCNLVPLKNKAERTQQTYTTNAQNERVLTEMTFAGDKASHVLVQ